MGTCRLLQTPLSTEPQESKFLPTLPKRFNDTTGARAIMAVCDLTTHNPDQDQPQDHVVNPLAALRRSKG